MESSWASSFWCILQQLRDKRASMRCEIQTWKLFIMNIIGRWTHKKMCTFPQWNFGGLWTGIELPFKHCSHSIFQSIFFFFLFVSISWMWLCYLHPPRPPQSQTTTSDGDVLSTFREQRGCPVSSSSSSCVEETWTYDETNQMFTSYIRNETALDYTDVSMVSFVWVVATEVDQALFIKPAYCTAQCL